MTWNNEMRQFVAEHISDDTTRLLLSAHRYPSIDVPFAVEQIEARRRLRTKLPQWYALADLVMCGRIPAEQCSSEQTARFKRSVMLSDARSLCDMTGGMGVDFWYMSRGLDRAIYTERQPMLCEAAAHNFEVLTEALCGDSATAPDIVVRDGLSTELPIPDVDVIYLDPARRASDGARIYEIADCEPNVVDWQDQLLSHCRQLITKVSPMADISRTLQRLHHVSDVYVLGVRNECKELLIVQQPSYTDTVFQLHCIDLFPAATMQFHVPLAQLNSSNIVMASSLGQYFYEPDVTVMKCQAFGVLSSRFDVAMLDTDCHYFTSDCLMPDFPGRIFVVDEVIPFSSKVLRRLRSDIPQANVAARGFALTADQLRARTGIRDGGEVYLFGAKLRTEGPVIVRCHKPSV